MSNKKRAVKTTRSARVSARQSKPNRAIQWVGLAILLLAVGGIIWAIWASQAPAQEAASNPSELPNPKKYDSVPAMQIDKQKRYTATVKMVKGGEFVIQLYPDKAPLAVNSFVFLAREGFFDGVTFHRVLDGFMAQGGDPTGTGGGGPGYQFDNEDSDLKFDKAGVVAMANAGRDTNGSQFFITFAPAPHLDGGYTIFGQVISGMDIVNGLRRRDPLKFPDYTGDAIESIIITEE